MLNMDILNINPETVCFIINKAKEFHAKEEVTFSEQIPDSEYEYDWSQILADHADDLTYIEVRNVIENLDPNQQTDLLTLMYVGRGDFDISEWSKAHKEARNNLLPNLTDYLFSKPLIAYYLEKALELLDYSCDK
ncbi:TPA: DUF3775 domain-containing protein [Legionella pneumophila]|uniref:DUF3775 domain-containing protein n=1 Tax=Legionella pneumophila TaxID=446 RepID=UPI0007887F32|nr:DUF3775 domain-containing protein [Legionella pneumophila]MDW8879258.1 DUF3775 domain-containing protein [Legionella pneumophila subsp. fraseri]MDW8961736.1 DUF3775 domain-containing protein [Legionella pneumophila subsp. fraseri]MDW9035722.1 DUF3775 domain-containing protein [Legionella pneumophila subsp. fraseri]MDW9039081.1 DUF3775 domain-containing protein [Legionella pneumophila subsp. fraseri]MDW9041929.1 DUF3775 domain-containing protein [Legionella pneumophila subsp. fraseri]